MKTFSSLCFVGLLVGFLGATVGQEKCKRCLLAEQCPLFGSMTKGDQTTWMEQHSCQRTEDDDVNTLFGFAPVAKGDYICCPEENVWGIEGPSKPQGSEQGIPDYSQQYQIPDQNQNNGNENSESGESEEGDDSELEESRLPHQGILPSRHHHHHHHHPRPNTHQPINNYPNYGSNGNYPIGQNNNRPNGNFNRPNGNFNRPNGNFNRPNGNFNGQNGNFNGQNGNFNGQNGNFNGQNSNFNGQNGRSNGQNGNYPQISGQRPGNGIGNTGRLNVGEQCSRLTSYPPAPESGCCGLEATVGFNAGPQNGFMNRPSSQNQWNSPRQPQYSWSAPRYPRDAADETYGITVDNRIAGGKETYLEQYPWTVLLKTTFDYGNKKASFNCGGSIISARYVLTAAHCVYEAGASITDVEINLAEFDKRTFPRDCINVPGEGRKCIENIVMHAEDVVRHPQYDDDKLQNDIALIRLQGNAPFTDYIRPICLPPIDIDNPQYSDLRLAVAGWGRNGTTAKSQVKQSTVVNLVPQRQCEKAYPHLTRKHVCAAGHSGEDTCKGDSGGPLMMLYEGKYFVSGIVSGKRADAPCGTAVPSLYTNVYQYVDWIRRNINS